MIQNKGKNVVVIGGGIGGLATACLLAKAGISVSIYEQQSAVGGRAGQFEAEGFLFDSGPSWYLMPEVFEHFFGIMDVRVDDVLKLKRLSPGYTVYFEDGSEPVTIHGDIDKDAATFEAIEKGAGESLRRYLHDAEETYRVATESFLFTNFEKPLKFLDIKTLLTVPKMARLATQPIDRYVSRYFTNSKLKQILEYPMVFLGTSPFTAPSLYHLMSHMDFSQGVFYPEGGIYEIITAMQKIAKDAGVRIVTDAPVAKINVVSGRATGVTLRSGEVVESDIVVSNADLYHTENSLLQEDERTYPAKYWKNKEAGPSALLMYLGVKGTLPIGHHTLLFADKWKANFDSIFVHKTVPHPASLYICKPSASDSVVAPVGYENMFVLVPIPADDAAIDLQKHADEYIEQVSTMLGIKDLKQRIVYKKLFGPADFASTLHSWRGTALGLSHRLSQSAVFRPRNKSKKVSGLYYVGGNTIPGIGMPMCLISAELIYKRLAKDYSNGMVQSIREITELPT